jgi:hypothetical protein
MHESLLHPISSFITLTYDNENLPEGKSLEKIHVQAFIKKLRKKIYPEKIRYYLVGEYGDETQRPHYHAIMFNYWPDDSRYYKSTPDGKYFRSSNLNSLWGKGNCLIASVSFDTAAYTARYVTKKITGEEARFHYSGRSPEFALMSRRPGIGQPFWKKYCDQIISDDHIVINGRKMPLPKSYKDYIRNEYVSEYWQNKFNAPKTKKLSFEQRQIKSKITEARLKIKKRNKI